jgi:hypothetical protein
MMLHAQAWRRYTQQQQQQQPPFTRPIARSCPFYLADSHARHQHDSSKVQRMDYCRGKCLMTVVGASGATSQVGAPVCVNLFLHEAAKGKYSPGSLADCIYTQYSRVDAYAKRVYKAEEEAKACHAREAEMAHKIHTLDTTLTAYRDLAADLARRLHLAVLVHCTVCQEKVTPNDIPPGTLVTTILNKTHTSPACGEAELPLVPHSYATCVHCSQTVHMRRQCSGMAPDPSRSDQRICMRCAPLLLQLKPVYGLFNHEPTVEQIELHKMELQMHAAYKLEEQETERRASLVMSRPLGAWDTEPYESEIPINIHPSVRHKRARTDTARVSCIFDASDACSCCSSD